MADRLDDPDYPAYTTGRAAEALGGAASLPARPGRRGDSHTGAVGERAPTLYRRQLAFAGRIRELADHPRLLAVRWRDIASERRMMRLEPIHNGIV